MIFCARLRAGRLKRKDNAVSAQLDESWLDPGRPGLGPAAAA